MTDLPPLAHETDDIAVAQEGLVYAYTLDGKGGATKLDWPDLDGPLPMRQLWVYLEGNNDRATDWLVHRSGLDPLVTDAMLAEETRPRATFFGNGIKVNLRGVNLNPGAEPEDMVSLRMWVDQNRLICLRLRPVVAVRDVRRSLEAGSGPRDVHQLFVSLCDRLTDRIEGVIDELYDELTRLEDEVMKAEDPDLRMRISDLRRQVIELRRYIGPQREALTKLSVEDMPWLNRRDRDHFRELADIITRYVEDLDEMRDRAVVVQEELTTKLSEKTNRNLMVLSVVTVFFTPLTLLSGIFGMNVGGIPFQHTVWGFAEIGLVLAVIALVEWWVMKKLKWF